MRPIFAALLIVMTSCTQSGNAMNDKGDSQTPSWTVRFSLAPETQDELIRSLQSFADRYGFAVRVGRPGPMPSHVTVELWREDWKVLVVNPFEPENYRASFYRMGEDALPPEVLEGLASDFKRSVTDVEGARVTSESR